MGYKPLLPKVINCQEKYQSSSPDRAAPSSPAATQRGYIPEGYYELIIHHFLGISSCLFKQWHRNDHQFT